MDTLSVVALALAVLAFAAQLIVSLAQASASAQQIAQTERINASTQSALSELRTAANSLLANQKEVFGHVLRAALPEVARELSADSDDVSAGEGESLLSQEEIESRLEEAVSKVLHKIDSNSVIQRSNRQPDPLLHLLRKPLWDEREVGHYKEILNSLPADGRRVFNFFVRTFLRRLERGQKNSPIMIRPDRLEIYKKLEEAGLIQANVISAAEDRVSLRPILTESGIGAARVIINT